MASVLVTNTTSESVLLSEFYITLGPVGQTDPLTQQVDNATIVMPIADFANKIELQGLIADGTVTAVVTPDADEENSDLITAPLSVSAESVVEVAAADAASPLLVIRKAFTAAAAGTADDVTIFAANALPFKFRILDSWVFISTAIAMTSAVLRDQAAGAGTAAATLSTASTGRAAGAPTSDASTVFTPGSTKGLFLRRGDRGVAGEVFVLVRKES